MLKLNQMENLKTVAEQIEKLLAENSLELRVAHTFQLVPKVKKDDDNKEPEVSK